MQNRQTDFARDRRLTCSMLHTQPLLYAPLTFLKQVSLNQNIPLKKKKKAKINENKPAKGVKTKIRDSKLRSGVNWQGALKAKTR
jgi:hypothetical protein